jgi:hypothetical protein
MSPLPLLLLAQCLTPADQTAGWKHTPIPHGAPALAAPADVEQFRTGEPALVVDRDESFEHTSDKHTGSLDLFFRPPRNSQHLRITFAHRLDGMKVDAAVVDRRGLKMPLLDGHRVGGSELGLDWGHAEVAQVQVTLHHHLREAPVVYGWRAGSWETPSELDGAPEAFRTPGTLHWRHPGGRTVSLCNAPDRRLEVWGTGFARRAVATQRSP